jgi:hypothetical protein
MRDETRQILLWADGICIDQSNDREKETQIPMMGQIYSRAINTVIYFGPADIDISEALCLDATRASAQQSKGPEGIRRRELLDSILDKKWFTRVWVFQELIFSINPWIQCG